MMQSITRSIIPISVILVILILLPHPVQAASTQNLSWGVSVGDLYTYHFEYRNYEYPVYNRSFDIVVNITGLPDIPDVVSSIGSTYYFPIHANVSMHFANGTDIGMIAAHLPSLVWPVGNWPLWSNLVSESLRGEYSVVNDEYPETISTWSCQYTANKSDDLYDDATYVFDKATGVLNYLNFTNYWEGSPLFTYYLERFYVTTPGPMNGTLLVAAGLGVGVVIMVVVIFAVRKFR